MKCQALVEEVRGDQVLLRFSSGVYSLPRAALPPELEVADVLDIVIFVNEKETLRRIAQVRRWLHAVGACRQVAQEG
ncbi:MAG: hypothetical protein ACOX18_03945 [Bacillota bacterium]|jgi:hypothetical protein